MEWNSHTSCKSTLAIRSGGNRQLWIYWFGKHYGLTDYWSTCRPIRTRPNRAHRSALRLRRICADGITAASTVCSGAGINSRRPWGAGQLRCQPSSDLFDRSNSTKSNEQSVISHLLSGGSDLLNANFSVLEPMGVGWHMHVRNHSDGTCNRC